MARLLLKALTAAGFDPVVASTLRTLDKAGSAEEQDRLRRASAVEASLLIEAFRALPSARRPRLWFTYHVYYKAPDWIGPAVAQALAIPYCVAEASRAGKRADGPWALGHQGAEAALDRAKVLFVMTAQDREALERDAAPEQILVDLPPFLESVDGPPDGPRRSDNPRLLTVAMMRAGDKLASYRILADALSRIGSPAWTLDIVGDGEARPAVEGLFSRFGQQVRFHGQVDDPARLRALYAAADLFAWPAVNEAYGMVFLEAQAAGCPVVAGAYGGVPSVVRHDGTGLLTPPGDPAAFAAAVEALVADPERRLRLGAEARRFVRAERSLSQASATLRATLVPLAEGVRPCA